MLATYSAHIIEMVWRSALWFQTPSIYTSSWGLIMHHKHLLLPFHSAYYTNIFIFVGYKCTHDVELKCICK